MVDQLIARIRTEASTVARRLRHAPGTGLSLGKSPVLGERNLLYVDRGRMREAMLDNSVYEPRQYGGMLPEVYRLLQRTPEGDVLPPIVGYFNPVRPIVDFYTNSLGGRLGTDIVIADDVKDDKPIHPQLKAMVGLLWRWSNLDMRLAEFTTLVANQGTVGIRVVNDPDTGRVWLDFDDRRLIRNAETDTRGNCLSVTLRYFYDQRSEQGDVIGRVQVDEIISKYGFSLKVGGEEVLSPEQQENPLGICPYVLVKHKPVPGDVFGTHAYDGSEIVIHAINHAANQLDESDLAHIWPTWFMTSPAQGTPSRIKFGRNRLVYAQTRQGDPAPTMEAMSPDMDKAGTINFINQRIGWLENRQPQLAYSNLTLLSGQSGETLANVLRCAEAEALRARWIYEDGIKRALQLGMSIGIANGLDGFDLGTGVGTVDAADAAFDDGDGPEAFEFAPRPALPQTTFQKVQQATADQAEMKARADLATSLKALGVPQNEQWRTLGYDEKKIAELKAEQGEQSTLEIEGDDVDA